MNINSNLQKVKSFVVKGIRFDMILVEGGTFTMGATPEQGDDVYEWEQPAHKVVLNNYYICETVVTQDLWRVVMGNNPSQFKGANLPVENISWYDCQDFIERLNQLTGENFRLPTEAEWEFAARGGNKSMSYKYSGSNNLGTVAWYKIACKDKTQVVATRTSNELGVYDMCGNVGEWCQDWMYSYSSEPVVNPQGPKRGNSKIYRGGCYNSTDWDCRISCRFECDPEGKSRYNGFRLALDI